MSSTNTERVAEHIKEYGAKGILIHTIPGTPFWLICQLNAQTEKWKITLCHPMHKKAYTIADEISEKEHFELWNELVQLELSRRVKIAIKTLKQKMENYLRNRVSKPFKMAKINSSPYKKNNTLRLTVKIARASIKEIRANKK